MAQRIGQFQRIFALLLQTARIDILAAVQRRVILRDIADKGEIIAGNARGQHGREIGIVGQVFVDLAIKRRGGVVRHAVGIELDQLAVAGAGLEQIAGALVAAGLDIDHRADPGARHGIAQIEGRTQKPWLLAIREQSDDGVGRRAPRLQRPDGFQQDRDTRSVIRRARTRGDGVAVRHQQDRLAVLGDTPATMLVTVPQGR